MPDSILPKTQMPRRTETLFQEPWSTKGSPLCITLTFTFKPIRVYKDKFGLRTIRSSTTRTSSMRTLFSKALTPLPTSMSEQQRPSVLSLLLIMRTWLARELVVILTNSSSLAEMTRLRALEEGVTRRLRRSVYLKRQRGCGGMGYTLL